MALLATILSLISGVGSLVCLVIVLLKLFPTEGVLKGILGVICALYTFIWGWQNKDRFGFQNVMMIWTGMVVLGLVANLMARAGG